MRDLLPPLVLLVGLAVAIDARAGDLSDVRCDAGPVEAALCDALEREAVALEQVAGARLEARALERERDALRAQLADLKANYQSVKDLQVQTRRQRTAALVAGLLGGAAVAYGSVWVAGRLR